MMEDPDDPEDEQRNREKEISVQEGAGGDNVKEEMRERESEQGSLAQTPLITAVPGEDVPGEKDEEGMLDEEGDSGGQEDTTKTPLPPRGNLKVTHQDTAEEMRDVSPVLMKGRGRPRKVSASADEDRQETIFPGPGKGSVPDRGVGCCLDPKDNGVNPGGGDEGAPGPPGRNKISS